MDTAPPSGRPTEFEHKLVRLGIMQHIRHKSALIIKTNKDRTVFISHIAVIINAAGAEENLDRKQSSGVWWWWVLLRSTEAFGGAPLKCPSDSLPHYLASPECQPALVQEGGIRMPRSACPEGTQRARGCALAKGPLIISPAQSFRDSH